MSREMLHADIRHEIVKAGEAAAEEGCGYDLLRWALWPMPPRRTIPPGGRQPGRNFQIRPPGRRGFPRHSDGGAPRRAARQSDRADGRRQITLTLVSSALRDETARRHVENYRVDRQVDSRRVARCRLRRRRADALPFVSQARIRLSASTRAPAISLRKVTTPDETSFCEGQAGQIRVEALYDCHIGWNPGQTFYVPAHSLRHNPME